MPDTRRVAMIAALFAALVFLPGAASAQLSDTATWAAAATIHYRTTPNITYLTANNMDLKLDVYSAPKASPAPPTLIYIHGGGWVGGSKEGAFMNVLPYMEKGWNVVNVQYRLGRVSLAPAAVEDCRCALRWVLRNAKDYNIDVSKLVVTGHSAGGHLSLTTGMLPTSAGLDRECPGKDEPKVAAIVNWYGITDVEDILDGPNMQTYAVAWMGSMLNRNEIARRVSPLTYVRSGLPPIITIHGDADTTVPYQHAVRLRDALDKAGVPNQLVTIKDGKHGGFSREQTLQIFDTISKFLAEKAHLK